VDKANPCLRTLTPVSTRQPYLGRHNSGSADAPIGTPRETEQALSVVLIYQDPLTRSWADELWDRVRQVVDGGGISRKSWRLRDLVDDLAFAAAVRAAADADVIVISVRDTGDLPPLLHAWAAGWMPRRAGRAGALVAIVGMPTKPDGLSGRACEYLEVVARLAGLDFLPRERGLPEESPARSTPSRIGPVTDLATAWHGAGPGRDPSARLRWRLVE
jgi:hypothetical protein